MRRGASIARLRQPSLAATVANMKELVPDLEERLAAKRFVPFALHLTDGRVLEVKHPDFLTITARKRIIFEPEEGGAIWVLPLHVVSVDDMMTAA